MNNLLETKQGKVRGFPVGPAVVVLLVTGGLLTWWMMNRAENELRATLLQQTRLVGQALNIADVRALAGTEDDLEKGEYLRLKDQLAAIKQADNRCRFAYLVGRKPDGALFFFVDNELPDSKDYSPPGQLYEEASPGLRQVFQTGVGIVEGPYADRWGTWVSALVPLTDPDTGKLLALLGMDIDARTWKNTLAAATALPMGLMLTLLIVLMAAFLSVRRGSALPKPVLRRLFPPLTAMLILLVTLAGALLWYQHRKILNERTAMLAAEVQVDLQNALNEQARGLAATLHAIAMDDRVRQALRGGDRERLLADWRALYQTLHRESGLTHFKFSDANRVCLLRVHKPEKHGDRFDRFTILEAERTGKTASGIELGLLGTFTLRVVKPVFDDSALLGFVELGMEIEDVLQTIRGRMAGVELAVVIRKQALDRETWEAGMRMLGREADWGRLRRGVVVHASQGRLPDAFLPLADQDPERGDEYDASDREIAAEGKAWRVMALPLKNASGKEVGNLLVMNDITAEKAAFHHTLAVGGVCAVVLLAALLGMVFVLLYRTDAGIRAQQRALSESQEHLAATLRSIGDGVITCDAGGRIVSLNAAAERMTGWPTADAAGRPVEEVFRILNAQTRESAENPVERVLREGVSVSLANHTALIARDGTEHQIADSCAPIRDTDGTLGGVVLVFRDVTEEYRRREQLRESEEQQRQLIEHAVSAIAVHEIVLDDAGRAVDYIYLSANPAFERHTGLRPEDVVGRRAGEVLPGIEKTPFIEIFGKVVQTGESVSIEQYCEPLRRHLFINAYRLGTGRFATVFTNITERKQMETMLRDNEARLRGITESAQDAIIMMDNRGDISFWNPAAEKILGYQADEVLGRNLHELLAPERFHEQHNKAYSQFVKTGQGDAIGKTVELAARRKDAREITVALSLSAVSLNNEWHAVGILRDISERKQAEQALLETNRELENATARANEMAARAEMASIAKSEFLANMSHEIRTPLNGIIGMTHLLLDTPLGDEQRRHAEVVRNSGDLLLGLINDILDFSKIEAGKLELEELDFDLQSLLDDFAATLALRAQEKGIELLCGTDPATPTLLHGDPGRLRQILTNLAGNAIKFTHVGEVAIHVAPQSQTEETALLRFTVRDTGIGIPEQKINLLFEKFTQADASTTRKYGGTGLGLAISKQLAEIMGGEIGVDSKEGKGTEFWFTVRLRKQIRGTKPPSYPAAGLSGIRILIVDDNATNREILTKQMLSWGMRPTETFNGPSAIQALYNALADKDPFLLAVIDMQMPDMNGETLGRIIRTDPRLSETRMVMLTSLGARGDTKLFAEIGFAAYLTKPIRHQELKGVLSLVLAGQSMELPRKLPIVTRHTVRETLAPFAGSNARILLAEDNITNQQVALGILKKFGLDADAVANGEEALVALKSIPYDLVLMDVQMPVMDGLEATRRIRDRETSLLNPAIPVIAMTAHAMHGDREKCLRAGMNDYVPKPLSPQNLAETLEKWLPKKTLLAKESKQTETPTVPEPVVWNKEEMLARMMNDNALFHRISRRFLEDIPKQIQTLVGYVEAGDVSGVERQAHTIKGASAQIGGPCLSAVAANMEQAARDGNLQRAAAFLPELHAEFQRLKQAMEHSG
jgi:PAS domain S-box-containing protein